MEDELLIIIQLKQLQQNLQKLLMLLEEKRVIQILERVVQPKQIVPQGEVVQITLRLELVTNLHQLQEVQVIDSKLIQVLVIPHLQVEAQEREVRGQEAHQVQDRVHQVEEDNIQTHKP